MDASVASAAIGAFQPIREHHSKVITHYLLLCEKWQDGVHLPAALPTLHRLPSCPFSPSSRRSPVPKGMAASLPLFHIHHLGDLLPGLIMGRDLALPIGFFPLACSPYHGLPRN